MGPCCCGGREVSSDDVVGAINEHNGEILSIEYLADELGVDVEDLRSIIVQLRAMAKVKVDFNRQTGELVIGEPVLRSIDKSATQSPCPYCGHNSPQGARFCPNCGSSLE